MGSPLKVNSSRIEQVMYDHDTQVLTVWFKRGGVYEYLKVDEESWDAFIGHPSPGRGLNQYIIGTFEAIRK